MASWLLKILCISHAEYQLLATVDHPVITSPDEDPLHVEEDVLATIICRADHGYPPFSLHWEIDGKKVLKAAR